ncbi:hypothetical protein Y1Q_0007010 [Alligator mississippiensis]|uniref:Uncharacterized protein n=1 Tax=Alligator mississippiensis TaxID=8496 RepID=A0A151NWW6_ALLMI|nr:hypothetical protein Y1Q_0007010 [Alligator mississippiensis]
MEATWELSAEASFMVSFPAPDLSLKAGGTWLLSRAEEQAPEEGPVNLEPTQTSLGGLGEMDSLRPERDLWHRSQGRPQKQKNVAVNQPKASKSTQGRSHIHALIVGRALAGVTTWPGTS